MPLRNKSRKRNNRAGQFVVKMPPYYVYKLTEDKTPLRIARQYPSSIEWKLFCKLKAKTNGSALG